MRLRKRRCENRHFPMLKHFSTCRKTDLKIKSTSSAARVNEPQHPAARRPLSLVTLTLASNEHATTWCERCLIKAKGWWSCTAARGEHLPFVRRLAARSNSGRYPMFRRRKEKRGRRSRREGRTIREEDATRTKGLSSIATSNVESPEWLGFLIANTAHIRSWLAGTLSSLTLPDKSNGSCFLAEGRKSRQKYIQVRCWNAFVEIRRHR